MHVKDSVTVKTVGWISLFDGGKLEEFVGHLWADKSLELCARDLIYFTADLQAEIYNSTNHCWTWSIS